MTVDDRVGPDEVAATRAGVRRMYRRTMFVAFAGSLLFSLFCAVLMYYVPSARSLEAAAVVGALAFIFLGGSLALHWWRHYNSIFKQLDVIERRVQAGEVIHGSEVTFHE